MGLDFSYLLYFKRDSLWELLQDVAARARPSELPTLVAFPDHILSLSLRCSNEKDRLVRCDGPEFGFDTSIYFPEDEEITDYAKRLFPEYYEEMSKESPLGFPIGCIYLTVYNDLSAFHQKVRDPDLVMLEFGTPGTTMSLLFSVSASIRERFTGLLENHSGICGLLNMENEALVFWLDGRRLDETIPSPWSSPAEIRDMLKGT
jgi:hypothetical protein